MLNVVAQNLSYIGMVLVVETVSRKRCWAVTAIFDSHQVLYSLGDSPNAALDALVAAAWGRKPPSPQESTGCLDSIAKDLLQLIVARNESSGSGPCWRATARFRRTWLFGKPRSVTVTADQPDAALAELVCQVRK